MRGAYCPGGDFAMNSTIDQGMNACPDLTDNELDMFRLRDFIDSLGNVDRVEVLPYHNMGIEKYKKLGIEYILENTHLPTEESIKKAEEILCNR